MYLPWKIILGNFYYHYDSDHSKKNAQTMFCVVCRLKNKSRFVSIGVVDFASRKITYSTGMKSPQLISTLYRPGPAVALKHLKISGSFIQLFLPSEGFSCALPRFSRKNFGTQRMLAETPTLCATQPCTRLVFYFFFFFFSFLFFLLTRTFLIRTLMLRLPKM